MKQGLFEFLDTKYPEVPNNIAAGKGDQRGNRKECLRQRSKKFKKAAGMERYNGINARYQASPQGSIQSTQQITKGHEARVHC